MDPGGGDVGNWQTLQDGSVQLYNVVSLPNLLLVSALQPAKNGGLFAILLFKVVN
jgi:hypothetical protein